MEKMGALPEDGQEKMPAIRHIENKKLKELEEKYKQDPESFYFQNEFDVVNNGNKVLIKAADLCAKFIVEIWKEKGYGDSSQLVKDAKDAGMLAMKYLGADVMGWFKVSPETLAGVVQKMGDEDYMKQSEFILKSIKSADPDFSHFLAEICVRNPRSGEVRSGEEIVAINNMVNVVVRTIYEQIQKDGRMN